jgi:NTP pyrophosphatase (non-canonical NTP hydrolase)
MQNSNFRQIQDISLEIKNIYNEINQKDGHFEWKVSDYAMGMVGDTGDLCKLIMAKSNLRRTQSKNVDQDIEHEIVDILWSLIVIANELNIDLEKSSLDQLTKLRAGVEKVKFNTQNKQKTKE